MIFRKIGIFTHVIVTQHQTHIESSLTKLNRIVTPIIHKVLQISLIPFNPLLAFLIDYLI